jgi:anti-anti-sigma factor
MDGRPDDDRSLPGSITVEIQDGRRVLCLTGDLDSAVVAHFKTQQGRAPVVVDAIDAGTVTFIGSAGLALMLMSWEASVTAGRRPVLDASSRSVDRLLAMSSLDQVIVRRVPEDDAGDPPAREAPPR